MRLDTERMALTIGSIPRGMTRESFSFPLDGTAWDISEAEPSSAEGILSLDVTRTENDIVVRGELEAWFIVQCAMCLDPVEFQVTEYIERIYSWDPEMLADPEVEPVSHNDGTVSILDAVREAVILSIPTVPLCDEDCRGLCPVCGINLNREICDHQIEG